MSLILDGTNGLSDVDGTAAAPAIRGTDANTGIFFPAADTIAFAEGGAEAMRISSNADVLVGTTTRSNNEKFTIFQNAAAMGISVRSLGSALGNYESSDENRVNYWTFGRDNATTGNFVFANNGTQRVAIDTSGNLLVNQTALNGAGKVEISYDRAGSWGMQIRNTTGTTAATTFIEFKYVNSTVGYIGSSNGTSTQYNTSSDYRLKEDIAPITGALAKVVALKPVTYKWKSTGTLDEGFIAHELAEVCPSAVTGTKDAVETYTDEDGNEATRPVYQGIDTSFLVATLTAAIQEQQALITALTTRITALEAA